MHNTNIIDGYSPVGPISVHITVVPKTELKPKMTNSAPTSDASHDPITEFVDLREAFKQTNRSARIDAFSYGEKTFKTRFYLPTSDASTPSRF